MDVELIVVPDCPHESGTLIRLHLAFERLGIVPPPIRTTVIVGHDQAVERGFVGSPAILVDGEDPVAVPGQPPALAAGCTPRRPGSPGYRRWTDWWLRWPQHTSGASAHERAST